MTSGATKGTVPRARVPMGVVSSSHRPKSMSLTSKEPGIPLFWLCDEEEGESSRFSGFRS